MPSCTGVLSLSGYMPRQNKVSFHDVETQYFHALSRADGCNGRRKTCAPLNDGM